MGRAQVAEEEGAAEDESLAIIGLGGAQAPLISTPGQPCSPTSASPSLPVRPTYVRRSGLTSSTPSSATPCPPVRRLPEHPLTLAGDPAATAEMSPISDSAGTPFTTRTRLARIFGIGTSFHATVDDTIIDVGPPLVRPWRRRASGGTQVWWDPSRVRSSEFKVRGSGRLSQTRGIAGAPRHREVFGVA